MEGQRATIRSLLVDLYAFALLFCVLAAPLFSITGSVRSVWFAFGLLVPFYAMSAARSIPWLPLFIATNILLTAWPLLLPMSVTMRLLLFGFMLLSGVYSLVTRLRGGWSFYLSSAAVGVAVAAGVAILSEQLALEGLAVPLQICAFAMAACYFICEQTGRVDDSLDILQNAARQPVKTTLRFNNAAIVPFLALCLLAALASGFVPLHIAAGALWQVVVIFLRWLFSHHAGRDSVPVPERMQDTEPGASLSDVFSDAGPPPILVKILETIFLYLGWTAIIALAGFAIFLAARAFLRRFYAARRSGDGDLREYIGPNIRIVAERPGRGLRRRRPLFFFGRSREEKIRRVYYRKVSRHIKRGAGIRATDTSGEIERRLLEKEDISALTDSYNQARYGDGQ